MSRPPSFPAPKYRKHKQIGQAVVTLTDGVGGRKDYLLGLFGSAASKREYGRLIGEWAAAGHCIPHVGPTPADLSVNELILRFWTHAQQFYRHPDGRPTGEVNGYKLSLRTVRELYGHTPAAEFGPLALKTVRDRMVAAGLSRNVVNQRIGRVRRMFKWGSANS